MKVTQETVTVLPNAALGEVNIILAGLRITLTADESSLLARGLASSLEQLQGMQKQEAAAAETWGVGRSTPDAPDLRSGSAGKDAAAESEAMQQRTRALIQASMRDKKLSLREEQRE
jgi:hypothetical protein